MGSKEQGDPQFSNRIQRRLEQLRRRLQAGEWPEGADRLLADLAHMASAELEEDEATMLTLVLDDALQGVDVEERYPAFFQRIKEDAHLHMAFLEAFSILFGEKSEEEALPPLPTPDLSFLEGVRSPAPDIRKTPGNWYVAWRRTQAQLQRLFERTFLNLSPGFRSADLLETDTLALVQGAVTAGEQEVELVLEAARLPDTPNQLNLSLLLIRGSSSGAQATVRWGNYSATAPIDRRGRAAFPPISLRAVTDSAGERIAAGLELTLSF